MREQTALVVTSIAPPNTALRALAEGAEMNEWPFYIIGDVSSPSDFSLPGAEFLSVGQQIETGLATAKASPTRPLRAQEHRVPFGNAWRSFSDRRDRRRQYPFAGILEATSVPAKSARGSDRGVDERLRLFQQPTDLAAWTATRCHPKAAG